jgi:hypothetical protein
MHKTWKLTFTLALIGLVVSGLSYPRAAFPDGANPTDKVYVGFHDDAREEMVNGKPGVAGKRVIRPAFERSASGWHPANATSLAPRMKWTIAFDGRNLGSVESEADRSGGLTPFQTILTPVADVPSVGSPSEKFAGLLGHPAKMRRPLVAVSKPYFEDPDGWKRTKPPDEIGRLVRAAFRRKYPRVDRCKEEEVAEKNWKFPDSALALPVVYASNKHSFLVQASLNAGECGYVDDPDDPLADPWFFVSSEGEVRRIGSFMSLLDAGDYGNDQHSEVIFFLSQGENTDGFVLFDSTFGKPVFFSWHYH